MIFDTFHTLSVVKEEEEGGFEEEPAFESTLRISSVTGPKTFTKRSLHLSMDMMLKISDLTSIVLSELFKKPFDMKQVF